MMHLLRSAAACLILGGLTLAAEDPAQKAIVDAFAAKCVMSKAVYDEAGNVRKLALSCHAAFHKDKSQPVPGGVNDAEFAAVLKLPRLEAIFLEKQPLSDRGYALLANLKELRDVRIHYPMGVKSKPAEMPPTPATADFALFLNDLPPQRILQLKHSFSVPGDGIGKLKLQPDLEHLEIDTICAGPAAVPFIVAAPKIRNLQVHRATWTDADLQKVLAGLPELEVLELKPNRMPNDPITGRSLRGLQNCSKLRLIQLVGNWKELPFEGGLDAVVPLKALRQINIAPSDLKGLSIESPEIQKLHKARPDLLINVGGKSIGGQPDQPRLGIDDGYDWGGQVTTHG
jgi:hypothetical protein